MLNVFEDFSINLIYFKIERLWPRVILRWRKSIVFIEVPLSTDWVVTIHQYIKAFTLESVEVFHLQMFLSSCPIEKISSTYQEEVMGVKGDTSLK